MFFQPVFIMIMKTWKKKNALYAGARDIQCENKRSQGRESPMEI